MEDSCGLSLDQAREYIRTRTQLFPPTADLEVSEISGSPQSVEGFVNLILRVQDRRTHQSVVIKKLLPYVRAMKEDSNVDCPVPLDRQRVEVEAFRLWNTLCPGSVPQILLWDEENAILVMEDLGRLKLARFEFARLKQFPRFASQVGEFLGRTAFYTSDLFLNPTDKKNLIRQFMNPEFRELLERVYFDEPFFEYQDRPINPDIQPEADAFRQDEQVLIEVLKLKELFVDRAQSLVHNDFHTANMFVSAEEFKVFDGEAASWGPSSYDLGMLFGNLILSCMSLQIVEEASLAEKIEYEDYLLRSMETIYHQFEQSFCEAWDAHVRPVYRRVPAYRTHYLKMILQEAVGFAGILSFPRIYDLGMSYDFARVQNLEQRAIGQRLLMRTARALIIQRETFQTIEDVTALLKQIKSEHKITVLVKERLKAYPGLISG